MTINKKNIFTQENKNKILDEFLSQAEFLGWNDKALRETFKEVKIDYKMVDLFFDDPLYDLSGMFIDTVNETTKKEIEGWQLNKMKIRDKIKNAILFRINYCDKYKLTLANMISFYKKNPKYLPLATKKLYETSDVIWTSIGDRSTDFNYYSKRAILSKIYLKVIFNFIGDDSKNNEDTKKLVEIEIAKIMNFEKAKRNVKNKLQNFCNIITNKKILSQDNLKEAPFFRVLFNRGI